MPDIAMCDGHGCPVKKRCHRHTAQASYMQAYASFAPNPDGPCADYIPQPEGTRHPR